MHRMDWNKTKNTFIITFLILNLFLGFQLYQKKERSQLDPITEASIEELLADDHITYGDLPTPPSKESYVGVTNYNFTNTKLDGLKDQKIMLLDATHLQGTFNKSIPISGSNATFRFNQFLKDYIYKGSSYIRWNVDKDLKQIICYQKIGDATIYNNEGGKLIIHLNDKNEMTGYEQTLLDVKDKIEVDKDILQPIKVLENLYLNKEIEPDSNITTVKLGYYNFSPVIANSDEAQMQILIPAWHIVVNKKDQYFMNAFEGDIVKGKTN